MTPMCHGTNPAQLYDLLTSVLYSYFVHASSEVHYLYSILLQYNF